MTGGYAWNTTEIPAEYVPVWLLMPDGREHIAWWDGSEWVVLVTGRGTLQGLPFAEGLGWRNVR